jgi:hypothetical protein
MKLRSACGDKGPYWDRPHAASRNLAQIMGAKEIGLDRLTRLGLTHGRHRNLPGSERAPHGGHGLSTDRNLSVKSQPRDRFPLLGRGAILGRL